MGISGLSFSPKYNINSKSAKVTNANFAVVTQYSKHVKCIQMKKT